MIRNFRDIGPACTGMHTAAERCRALIGLAEPASMDGYIPVPEQIVSSDDPMAIAMALLIYGTAVFR